MVFIYSNTKSNNQSLIIIKDIPFSREILQLTLTKTAEKCYAKPQCINPTPSSLLELLNKRQRALLDQESNQLHLASGDCLFEKGDSADNIYLVKTRKSNFISP